MIDKTHIEQFIQTGLLKVLNTEIFYHYTNYKVGIDEIIINNTLLFSKPEIFNDPFDCNVKLLKVEIDDKILNDTISKLPLSLSRQEKRELKRKYNNPSSLQKIIKKERNRFKLACFSELFDEVLLWSHYADKHRGICIGFDFPPIYEEKFILCPVSYLEELKSIDGMTEVYKVILYWLTSKSNRWEYEKEIRAITKNNSTENQEKIKFDPQYISEIIFGCNVSDNDIIKGIEKIKSIGINLNTITLKRMRIDENNFLLKGEIIDPHCL